MRDAGAIRRSPTGIVSSFRRGVQCGAATLFSHSTSSAELLADGRRGNYVASQIPSQRFARIGAIHGSGVVAGQDAERAACLWQRARPPTVPKAAGCGVPRVARLRARS